MAFEKIGIGGVLTFNSRNAVSGMYRTGRAFDQLHRRAGAVGRSAGLAAVGVGGLGMVTAPLAMAVAGAVKEYARFDQAMANVRAVSGSTAEQFKVQRAEAMRLGSDTKFTAEQAAQGMEALGRAGFNADQQIASMHGITMLATAENLELGKASEITARAINMFGLQASEAGLVADVLAYTSANSSTDVTKLANSMRYAGPKAAELGMSVEELNAVLGVLGDSGLTGSMAGTSLSNMFRAIAKPTDKAAGFLDKFNISLRDSQGEFIGTARLVRDLDEAFSSIANPKKRDFMKQAVLGERGARSFNILSRAQKSGDPNKNSITSLLSEIETQSKGSAENRANLMLNTMTGQVTLLKSAISNLNILFMDSFAGLDGTALAPLVETVQNLGKVWSHLDKGIPEDFIANKFGKNSLNFIKGVRKGIEDIKRGMEFISDQVRHFAYLIEQRLGGSGMEKLGRFVTVFGAIAVASTPVIAALLGIAFIITTTVIPVVSALATAVNAAFWPVLIAVAAIGLAFLALRNENEGFIDWSLRMWEAIKIGAMDLWVNVLQPLFAGIGHAAQIMWPAFRDNAVEAIGAIRHVFNEFAALFGEENGHQREGWMALGAIIMGVVMTAANILVNTLGSAFEIVANVIRDVRGIIQSLFDGDILTGLGKLAQFIGNTILLPVRLGAIALAGLLDAIMDIPGVELALGDGFRTAVDAIKKFGEEGVQVPGLTTPNAEDKVGALGPKSEAPEFESMADRAARFEAIKQANIAKNVEEESRRREKEFQMKKEENERGKRKEARDRKGPCTNLHLDGKKVAKNQSRHQQDLSDRMGFQTPPFIRRTAAAQGRVGN